MGPLFLLGFAQLAILIPYSCALPRLSGPSSHAILFLICFLMSAAVFAIFFGLPNPLSTDSPEAYRAAAALFGIPSLSMLGGSLVTWIITREVTQSVAIQSTAAAGTGLISLVLGSWYGVMLSLAAF